jgi:hypothetical protein
MVKFKLPITLYNENQGVFLGTVEGVYLVGLFTWQGVSKKWLNLHQEYFILPTSHASMKLRRELNRLQKDQQRLRSRLVPEGDGMNNKKYKAKLKPIVQEAYKITSQYLKNPPAPIYPAFTTDKDSWLDRQVVRALDSTDIWHSKDGVIPNSVPRWMTMAGRTFEGKTLEEMRLPKFNGLRYVKYVGINYFQLPNRRYTRQNPLLSNTMIQSMIRHHLK